MTHRERMLAAIRGEPTDEIPWAPRMDLWYIAQQARGTLPQRFVGKDLTQIADELGVACYAVRADYTKTGEANDSALAGLGLGNHPDYPYRIELRNLALEYHRDDQGRSLTTVRTPAGTITTCQQITRQMAADGISSSYEAILEALLACDAQVVFWGANYDRDTTWPPFFEEEIMPWLQKIP